MICDKGLLDSILCPLYVEDIDFLSSWQPGFPVNFTMALFLDFLKTFNLFFLSQPHLMEFHGFQRFPSIFGIPPGYSFFSFYPLDFQQQDLLVWLELTRSFLPFGGLICSTTELPYWTRPSIHITNHIILFLHCVLFATFLSQTQSFRHSVNIKH